MTLSKLLEKNHIQKIGRKPVVILPLEIWREIEDRLEDAEMRESEAFRERIAKARTEKKLYSAKQVKRLLGI